jgi:hypothetical protein
MMSHFQTSEIQQSKRGVCFEYLFNATLNCDFLFIRFMRLDSRLLKMLMPAWNALFWKHVRLAIGLCSWCLFLMLTLCITELVWKSSWLFTLKFIKENMYSHGNRVLHEILGLIPAIILTTFFCKVNIFLLLDELCQNITPHFIIEWKQAK